MRISDWSSDVCSSDLQNVDIERFRGESTEIPSSLNLKHLTPSHLEEDWQENIEEVAGNVCTVYKVVTASVPIWGIQSKTESWIINFEEGLLSQEIGRASCRERGCQYG